MVGASKTKPTPLVPIVIVNLLIVFTLKDGLGFPDGTQAPTAFGCQGSETAMPYLAAHSVKGITPERAMVFLTRAGAIATLVIIRYIAGSGPLDAGDGGCRDLVVFFPLEGWEAPFFFF